MKIIKIAMSLVLFSSFISTNVEATPLENNKTNLNELKKEFDEPTKELNKKLMSIYQNYKGEEQKQKLDAFYNNEDVKDLQEKYKNEVVGDPELEKSYIDEIKTFHNEVNMKATQEIELPTTSSMDNTRNSITTESVTANTYLNNLESKVVEQKIIPSPDGSFSIIKGTVTPIKKGNSNSTNAYTNGIGSYDFEWTSEYHHILYPNSKLVLKTFYETHQSSPHLTVYNASTAGTYGQLPIVTIASSANVNVPNATKSQRARTSANYNLTIVGYNGVGFYSQNLTFNVSFIILSYTSNSVTISTEGKVV